MGNTLLTLFGSLCAAVVGGIIAGGFALRSVRLSHEKDIERKVREEARLADAFVQSIRTEVDVLWDRYMETAGSRLIALPEGEPFLLYYPVSHDYFTVYNTSCDMVGKIANPSLRSSIVRTYTLAKALLDAYAFINASLVEFKRLKLLFDETRNPVYGNEASAALGSIGEMTKALREIHKKVESSIQEMRRLIDGSASHIIGA